MARRRGSQIEITGNEIQLVQFKLGDEFFGLKVEQVREIVKYSEVTHVPNMPAFIEGVMNLRGQITTIIDLRRRFGISSDDARSTQARIIVAEIGENQIGIIVDSVQDVIRVSSETISPTPEVLSSKIDSLFLTGICQLPDGLLMLLDLNNLLTDIEIDKFDQLDQIDKTEKTEGKSKIDDPQEMEIIDEKDNTEAIDRSDKIERIE